MLACATRATAANERAFYQCGAPSDIILPVPGAQCHNNGHWVTSCSGSHSIWDKSRAEKVVRGMRWRRWWWRPGLHGDHSVLLQCPVTVLAAAISSLDCWLV
ncbi:hypothetical protein J6590_061330 [Homalodisca vitripennis]|nr:hypothetical protein J6590_061330 [Homalodisca vitripennis]